FLPLARRFDWQLVGAYRVSQRPRQAVVLFALRHWSDLARLLAARVDDAELQRWFDYRDRLAVDLHELVLLPGRMDPLGIRGRERPSGDSTWRRPRSSPIGYLRPPWAVAPAARDRCRRRATARREHSAVAHTVSERPRVAIAPAPFDARVVV